MSFNKAQLIQSSSASRDNEYDYHITDDVKVKVNDVIRDNDYRLFFDTNLSFDHLMFLLNNRDSIEKGFIDFAIMQINRIIPDQSIRQVFLSKIAHFVESQYVVRSDTLVSRQLAFYQGDDDDDDYDADEDTISDDESEYDDDLENDLLDELEFAHFLFVSRYRPGDS
ncbi:unnamed protein product [Rotaria sp. Silwood2]|nr:unnamed protein product [Rotaria sp. Silwood2]CAF3213007.1 unnamed protein product [Rotaria sp. Silwood2]CAF3303554.1 unnamed protein product [Rotaria sp. Silwood2]CAF4020889.1 unnamed protein product [Rotaria sp. Silwood2]CAF4052742.1 unnamed protein product [Rotaria sp. Silwood2]